VSKGS
jgi:hypothetical protein